MTASAANGRLGPPEGGWGWIVSAGTLLITICMSIPASCFGVMLNDMLRMFETSTSMASWTMSISLALSSILSPLVSIAINTSSCRKTAIFGGLLLSCGMMLSATANNIQTLHLTFGIFTGIGYGCNRIVTICVTSQFFKRRYGIAAGITLIGYSLGRLIFSPIILIVKENYGFQGTFLIMGAMCLNICVGAALFQPAKWHQISLPVEEEAGAGVKERAIKNVGDEFSEKEPDAGIGDLATRGPESASGNQAEALLKSPMKNGRLMHKAEKTRETWHTTLANALDFSLLRQPLFYVVVSTGTLLQLVLVYTTVFLVPLGLDKGLQPMEATMMLPIRSVSEIVGRASIPWLLQLTNSNNIPTHVALSIANGILLIANALATDYITFAALAILNGIISSGLVVQNYHINLILFGPKKLPTTIGLTALVQGWFLLIVGPLVGYMRDVTGSLTSAFVLLAGIQFTHGFLWILKFLTSREKRMDDVSQT